MAEVITFYIPKNFRRKESKAQPDARGKVIQFGVAKKSA